MYVLLESKNDASNSHGRHHDRHRWQPTSLTEELDSATVGRTIGRTLGSTIGGIIGVTINLWLDSHCRIVRHFESGFLIRLDIERSALQKWELSRRRNASRVAGPDRHAGNVVETSFLNHSVVAVESVIVADVAVVSGSDADSDVADIAVRGLVKWNVDCFADGVEHFCGVSRGDVECTSRLQKPPGLNQAGLFPFLWTYHAGANTRGVWLHSIRVCLLEAICRSCCAQHCAVGKENR